MASFSPTLLIVVIICCTAAALATDPEQPLFRQSAVTEKDVVDKSATEEFDTTLNIDDFITAESTTEVNLTDIGIQVQADPTMGRYAEGDIAVRDLRSFVDNSNKRGKNAIRYSWRRWPDGEIPYTLSSRYGSYSRSVIARAMSHYHKKTCIRFVPREASKHRDYVYIHPDDGCYSLVGRTGGRQPLSLDQGCIQTGTVIHELMHAVGFFHEQSRADRDENIDINWSNVITEATDQFDKYSLRIITHLGVEYDYGSIMHYGPYAFSKNGRRTIRPTKDLPYDVDMGQRRGFSKIDLEKINSLYKCEGTTGGSVSVTEVPFVCKDNDWRCSFYKMDVFGYCGNGPNRDDKIKYKLCPKACGVCDELRPKPKTTTTTTTRRPRVTTEVRAIRPVKVTTDSASCRDYNKACSRWARSGHCRRAGYRTFMRNTCPATCGHCERPRASATTSTTTASVNACDDNPRFRTTCSVAKLLGRCASRGSRKYCRKTCGYCD